MIRVHFISLALLFQFSAYAQVYNSSAIFAHNDYARPIPFHTAYDLEVGFIEADVFLVDAQLMVAHHRHEIEQHKTLEDLYLKPLASKIIEHNGSVYRDPGQALTLMIDLKTEGVSTLNVVVDQIKKYPQLLSCPTLHVMISGSVPEPEKWIDYPEFITFDGRPGIDYTATQLQRIRMISSSFTKHVSWKGTGRLPDTARRKIRRLMEDAHSKKKMFRFWATPDVENAWAQFMEIGMDVIVTDKVTALSAFLKARQ